MDNKLRDWIFKRLIYLLEKKVEVIFKTDGNLKFPEDRRMTLFGYFNFRPIGRRERIIIFLSGKRSKHPTKEEMGKTLVHELCHSLFNVLTHERYILQVEKILWKSFTSEQKRIIKSYIPKHTVKQQPKKT